MFGNDLWGKPAMKTLKLSGLGAIGAAWTMLAALMSPEAAAQADAGEAGRAEAPAVLARSGVPCQMSDARKIGYDVKARTSYYEVACAPGGMGYVLQAPAEGSVTVFSCVEANTPAAPGQPPSAPCLLPGNANPHAVLEPLLRRAGFPCAAQQARGIGQTKTNTYLEVACRDGAGYLVVASVPFDEARPVQIQNCLMYDDAETNLRCGLGDAAGRLAVVDRYAAQANNGCVVKGRRFVGASGDSSMFLEAACQGGDGYIYKVAASGALLDVYPCAKANHLLGGCTLTDGRQAQADQTAGYARLAAAVGSSCDVERYAVFPARTAGEEVVEMVCKGGAGAIGFFPAGAQGRVVDCGRAPVVGYKCSMSADKGFRTLTADLRQHDVDACEVSDSRVVGRTDKGTIYMEVACADRQKGYMIEYQPAPAVTAVRAIGCALAGNCQLPGNN